MAFACCVGAALLEMVCSWSTQPSSSYVAVADPVLWVLNFVLEKEHDILRHDVGYTKTDSLKKYRNKI